MLPSSPRVRYVAATGATIIVSGGAFTAAQAATDPGATSTAAADANTARPAPYGGPTAAQLSAAAKDLGVSTTALRAAIQSARPARPSGTRPGRGDHAAALC